MGRDGRGCDKIYERMNIIYVNEGRCIDTIDKGYEGRGKLDAIRDTKEGRTLRYVRYGRIEMRG